MPTTSPKASSKRNRGPRRTQANVESITLSIREAAAYLGISVPVAYQEAKADRLPIIRIGTRILVVRPLLEEMVIERARRNLKA